jgi:uncharacterized RDD family membrane protein YckC
METATHDVPQDVLSSAYELNLVQASTGKRFANYLIDFAVFWILIVLFGVIAAVANPQSLESLADEESNIGASLLDRLVTMIIFGIYIGIVEALFKGKTIGKMITGTKAVNLDGTPISVKTAFMRGLSRSVPFEPFSGFGGNPWHDTWTDTMVIDEKLSNRI